MFNFFDYIDRKKILIEISNSCFDVIYHCGIFNCGSCSIYSFNTPEPLVRLQLPNSVFITIMARITKILHCISLFCISFVVRNC